MRTMILATTIAVAGCASAPPAPSELTNVQLCEAFFYAGEPYASQAGQEATFRGVRCVEYRDAVAQYRQAREAARRQAMQEALRYRPPPITYQPVQPQPVPRATYCTTQRIGNQLQTVCQ